MRRLLVLACLSLPFALAAPANAYTPGQTGAGLLSPGQVGDAESHGPDPDFVDGGLEAPGPAGGILGKPLTQALREKIAGAQVYLRLPGDWCGTARGNDYTDNELNNG